MATIEESSKKGRVPPIMPPGAAAERNLVDASADEADEPSKASPRWFRVLRAKDGTTKYEVPYNGQKTLIHAGKEISSANFRIEELKYAGVEMEAIDPPGWYRRLQERQASARK